MQRFTNYQKRILYEMAMGGFIIEEIPERLSFEDTDGNLYIFRLDTFKVLMDAGFLKIDEVKNQTNDPFINFYTTSQSAGYYLSRLRIIP